LRNVTFGKLPEESRRSGGHAFRRILHSPLTDIVAEHTIGDSNSFRIGADPQTEFGLHDYR